MSATILIAGATGTTGGATVRALVADPEVSAVKALVRDPSSDKAKALGELEGVELVTGNFTDTKSLDQALVGVKRAFLVSSPFPADATQDENEIAFLSACQRAGVLHVVRISTCHTLIAKDAPIMYGRAHWRIEQFANSSSCPPLTDLNPDFFSTNFNWWGNPGTELAFPTQEAAFDSKIGVIDPSDIGKTAAALLTIPEAKIAAHAGKKYELHGTPVSLNTVMAELSKVVGRTMEAKAVTAEAFTEMFMQGGLPEAAAKSFSNTCAICWGDQDAFRPYQVETDPALTALYSDRVPVADWVSALAPAFKSG